MVSRMFLNSSKGRRVAIKDWFASLKTVSVKFTFNYSAPSIIKFYIINISNTINNVFPCYNILNDETINGNIFINTMNNNKSTFINDYTYEITNPVILKDRIISDKIYKTVKNKYSKMRKNPTAKDKEKLEDYKNIFRQNN